MIRRRRILRAKDRCYLKQNLAYGFPRNTKNLVSFSQAIFLAIIQGLTEFLPISSSGHLVIFQKFFGLKPPVLFDILVHVGTLGAILVYFRDRLALILNGLVRKKKESWNIFWMVVIGTIPAAIIGLAPQNYINQIFDSLPLVGVTLLITAGFLLSSQWFKTLNRHFNKLKWSDAFIIGCFQALAILPGISRSGATIVPGLWRKLDRQTAFQFSFYLAVPAILGALILRIPELIDGHFNLLNQGILAMFVAGIVGYAALKILEKTLVSAKLWLFGIYCLILGMLILLSTPGISFTPGVDSY